MGEILVYTESIDGRAVSERLLAFARALADDTQRDVVALVPCAESCADPVLQAADVILECLHPALREYLPEAHALVLAAAIYARQPDLVLIENTTVGLDLGAAGAMGAQLPFVGYCVDLSLEGDEAVSVSEIYGGQVLATVRTPLPSVFSINASALPKPTSEAAGRGERALLTLPPALNDLRTTFVEHVSPPEAEVDITKADRLVCVGRGIGGANNVSVANELAEALGAELAASRPVADAGWVPKARQVGKSGVRVSPKLYVALGVSGAPEHLEGIRDAELIVAVNTDPAAPIFNVAHYGVVGDLFDVAEELSKVVAHGT